MNLLNGVVLFSYLGLTPVEYSSGEQERQGHISRQGRASLRHLFIEAAWVAIKKDNQLKAAYHRLEKTRGSKRAIVGIARRLAGRIRSCVKNGKRPRKYLYASAAKGSILKISRLNRKRYAT